METIILDRISEEELGPCEMDDVHIESLIRTLVKNARLLGPPLSDQMPPGRGTRGAAERRPLGPVGGGADAFAAAGLGPISYLVMGLHRIGTSGVIGITPPGRNAWKLGFASTLAALARGDDSDPTQPPRTVLGRQQARGRNAAVQLIKELGPERGAALLKRYTSFRGRDRALADLGGYEV